MTKKIMLKCKQNQFLNYIQYLLKYEHEKLWYHFIPSSIKSAYKLISSWQCNATLKDIWSYMYSCIFSFFKCIFDTFSPYLGMHFPYICLIHTLYKVTPPQNCQTFHYVFHPKNGTYRSRTSYWKKNIFLCFFLLHYVLLILYILHVERFHKVIFF